VETISIQLSISGLFFHDLSSMTDGTRPGDYAEVVATLTAERQARADAEAWATSAETQAATERQARAEAEAHLRELEAELCRLRGE
jgi:hypothetical protein